MQKTLLEKLCWQLTGGAGVWAAAATVGTQLLVKQELPSRVQVSHRSAGAQRERGARLDSVRFRRAAGNEDWGSRKQWPNGESQGERAGMCGTHIRGGRQGVTGSVPGP